ncbi:hypothetical protein, partial [Salmonella enterica]|uniref:hypothetical protein n=1 Tax=Salmonella enterica TaxID=28901 RepID=UPI003FA6C75D
MRNPFEVRLTVAALICCLAASAYAQDREHREMRRDPEAARMHADPVRLDRRYGHDHYYPVRGTVVPVRPVGSVSVAFGSNSWYFHGGV